MFQSKLAGLILTWTAPVHASPLSVAATIPEPAALSLMGGAMLVLGLIARSRTRKS